MKQNRVMYLGSERYSYYDEGYYADIYVNEALTRCWKVFKLRESKDKSHESFHSELKAYKLSELHKLVSKMVPKLFRSEYSNIVITDKDGNDVTSDYIEGLNYEMEFLDMKFGKLGAVSYVETQNIRKSFKEAGILSLSDASIAFDTDGNPKLIDFGVQEVEVMHESLIEVS